MDTGQVLNMLLLGLSRAAMLFLIASGLNLTFGVLHIINFAHGTLYLLGSYAAFSALMLIPHHVGYSFWVGLLFGIVILAAVAIVIELVLFRRLYGRDLLYQFVMAFAIVYILTDVMRMIWGQWSLNVSRPGLFSGSINIGGGPFPLYGFFVMGCSLIAGLVLWVVLFKTKLGSQARAMVVNREMAQAVGINVYLVGTVVFAIGAALAGFAGALGAGLGAIEPGTDLEVLTLAFVVVVIGGMGSISGAAAGALLVGILETVGIYLIPRASLAIVYLLLAIVLLWRPWGFRGTPAILEH